MGGFAGLGQGNFTVNVQHTDLAGNATTVSRQFYKDTQSPAAPTVTYNKTTFNRTDIGANTVVLTIDYAEAMDQTLAPTIVFSAPDPSAILSVGTGSAWTSTTQYKAYYTISDGASQMAVDVSVSGARDLAQNTQTSYSLVDAINIDITAPTASTVTMASNGNVGYAKLGNTVTLTIVSSESLSQINSPLIDGKVAIAANTDATHWTVSRVMTGTETPGALGFSFQMQDLAANTTNVSALTSGSAVIADFVAPTVTITTPSTPVADSRVNGTQLLTYTVTVEANPSANTQAEISGNGYANFASGAALSTLGGFAGLGQGNFTVNVRHTDLAGNATTVSRQFYKDTQSPAATVTLNKTAFNRTDIGNNKLVVTIDYNENMDITVNPTIVFSNPDVSTPISLGTGSAWTSATQYKAYYNIADVTGYYLGVDLSVTNAKDLAQNTQVANNGIDIFTMILTGPTLTTVTIASNNASPAWAKAGDVVTINITGSTDIRNVSATIAGQPATINNAGDANEATWRATYTMQNTDNNGLIAYAINFEDLTGNPGAQVTTTTNSSTVTYDKTAPVVNITAPIAGTKVNNRAITYTLTETNSGTTTASANGSTYAAFASGNNANVLGGFAGIAENTFTATIRHTDLAGNIGTATVSLVKDVTAPDLASFTLNCANGIADLTFTEGIYGNSDGTGQLSDTKLATLRTGSGKSLTSHFLSSVPSAGSSTATLTLMWSLTGTFTGNEIVNIDATNNTSIYDQAGNAMIAGTPAIHYSNIPITINNQPQNTSVCINTNTTISANVTAGNGATYQWQKYNTGTSAWDNLTADATYSNVTTTILGITNAPAILNGAAYRIAIINPCDNQNSSSAVLTVNPVTVVTVNPVASTICSNASANMSVTATGTGTLIYTWQYENGANNWVSAVNNTPAGATYTGLGTNMINVSTLSGGTYNYRARVQGDCGAVVNSNTALITVNPIPNANITASGTTTICNGTSVDLTADEVEAGNITYQWKKDNVNIDLATNRAFTATQSGVYTVVVTNTTTLCSSTTTVGTTVIVNPLPNASISAGGSTTICSGGNVILTAGEVSAANITYQWKKDDVDINLETSNTYSANANGVYTVVVTNTDNMCSATTAVGTTVTVINGAIAPTAANTDRNNFCTDDVGNIVLTVTGGSGSTLKWATDAAFTNVVGIGNNLSIASPTITTTYYARWETASCGNSNYVSVVVNVNQPSIAGTASGTTTLCSGSGTTISLNAYTGSIQWQSCTDNINFVNIGSATSSSLNTGNLAQTTYYRAVVTNGACSAVTSNTVTITINPLVTPTVSIAITTGVNPNCSGNSVTFTATPTNGGTPTYQWKVNGSNVGTGLTYSYIPNNNDIVSVVMTSSLSCVTSTTATSNNITMLISTTPTAPTSITSTANNFCADDANNMTLAAVGGVGTILRWATDAAFTNQIGTGTSLVLATPTVTTTYYARWETATCGNSSSANKVITVNLLPTAYNVSGGGDYCTGGTGVTISLSNSQLNVNYTLVLNGTPTANVIAGTGSAINFNNITSAGTYTISALNTNLCSALMTGNAVITVNPLPTINTVATAQTRCANGNVTFTSGTVSANSVIDWSLNNFSTVAQSGSNTFTTNVNVGSPITAYYRARNTVTGCMSAISQVVGTANALPTVSISGVANATQLQSVILTATSGSSSYSWSVDGGTITAGTGTNEITVNWATTGTKSVTVTATNAAGCQATSSVFNISISSACVVASITTSPSNTSVCQGSQATFTVIANGTNLTYAWYKVSTPSNILMGTASTLTISNAQSADAGTYFVIVDNNCTTDPGISSNNATLTVTVPSTPTVAIVSNDADNTICPATSVMFTATANNLGGGTVSYQWKLNAGNVGTNQNTYTTSALVNNDQVSCTITVAGGCVTSATANSNVIPNTVLTTTAINTQPQSTTANVNANATFTVVATGSNLTYAWYKVGQPGVVLGTNSTYTLNNAQIADNATQYYVTVTGSCGTVTSNNATLTVNLPASKLVITTVIAPQSSETPFNVTVVSQNANNVLANVTINTPVSFTLSTGTGTLSGTGTITAGTNTITIPVTYTYVNGYVGAVLSANASGLTSGLSNAFTLMPVEPNAPTLTSSSATRNTVTLNWSSSSAVMIFGIAGSPAAPIVTEANMDANAYSFTANTIFTTTTENQGSPSIGGAKLLYMGTGATVQITGLARNSSYTFAIYSYNGTTNTWNFNTNEVFLPLVTSNKDIIADEDGLINSKFELCRVSPNPAKDDISFCIDAFETNTYDIELFNASGDLVLSQSQVLNKGSHSMKLNLFTQKGGIAAGIYFLKVTADKESLTQQVIVMP